MYVKVKDWLQEGRNLKGKKPARLYITKEDNLRYRCLKLNKSCTIGKNINNFTNWRLSSKIAN